MKKIICLILSICLIFSLPVAAQEKSNICSEDSVADVDVPLEAEETNAAIGQTLDIKAKSAILMEVQTGQILYESNADEQLPPASITKIMSLLLVMEAINRGDLDLETVIAASEHACSMGGSQIWLEPGESMTVDDLLKAAVIGSANDATVALGEAVAGSEEGFVALMNERAKELGMNSTNFINCTGLDAEGHLTTAYDVAVMSRELIKHELIKNYSTVWMDTLRDGESELVNTNKLVRFYEGTTGLKTGTTSSAGYCLSATAERDGMELVAVIMSGDTSNDRFNGAKKLLDYGFANFNFSKIDSGLEEQPTVKVKKGTEKTLALNADGTVSLLLPKTSSGEIKRVTVLDETVAAPIKKGDTIGVVEIYVGDQKVGEIPLTASADVGKLSFGVTFKWILKGMITL